MVMVSEEDETPPWPSPTVYEKASVAT